ncbi:hypothetical protein ERO13_A12G017500v2 [Gossypium hirsutum]|nr:hypothetical protein ERO13_A12G017500v2 [Gossypium hirsutum]
MDICYFIPAAKQVLNTPFLSLLLGFWPQSRSVAAPPSDLVADHAQKGHDERSEVCWELTGAGFRFGARSG